MTVLAATMAVGVASAIQVVCPPTQVGETTLMLTAKITADQQTQPDGWAIKFRSTGPQKIAGWESVPMTVLRRLGAKPLSFAHHIRLNGETILLALSIPGGAENLTKMAPRFEAYSFSSKLFENHILASADCRIVTSGFSK